MIAETPARRQAVGISVSVQNGHKATKAQRKDFKNLCVFVALWHISPLSEQIQISNLNFEI